MLTDPFLRLDKEIDILAEQVTYQPSVYSRDTPMGFNDGLIEQLERIGSLASFLQTEALVGRIKPEIATEQFRMEAAMMTLKSSRKCAAGLLQV